MLLLHGTPLHRRIRPNWKELKENLLRYAVADILWAYVAIIMNLFS
jgi:hypothetical protein